MIMRGPRALRGKGTFSSGQKKDPIPVPHTLQCTAYIKRATPIVQLYYHVAVPYVDLCMAYCKAYELCRPYCTRSINAWQLAKQDM